MAGPKRARQCIFCSNPGGSKEHIWSEWMHPHLKKSETARYNSTRINQSPWVHEEKGRKNAVGSTENITVRAVCDNCNNGWMNRLEKEARPFLEPLIRGEPIALDFEQSHTLVEWTTMKAIVVEHSMPNAAVTPRAYREAFRARRVIPHYFRIYLASHDFEPVALMKREARCMAFNSNTPSPPLGGVTKNMQSLVLVVGKVFAVVHAARVDNFSIEAKVRFPKLYENCRIWPPDHAEMVWPSQHIFTAEEIDHIGACFDHLDDRGRIIWVREDAPQ